MSLDIPVTLIVISTHTTYKEADMSIFSYSLIKKRITEITLKDLESLGVKTLLVDVDNTLSTHHGTILVDGLLDWISNMQNNGIKLIVVSNSKKKRIKPFAERIGLSFVSLACKPLPFGYLKGIQMSGGVKKSTAIVGDQMFTDILGANLLGIKSVLTRPVKLENGVSFKIRRFFEKKILKENF